MSHTRTLSSFAGAVNLLQVTLLAGGLLVWLFWIMTQKGSTEDVGVAVLYIAAYNLLFCKNEIHIMERKLFLSI